MTPRQVTDMRGLRRDGYSDAALAQRFGVSRQRVHALLGARTRTPAKPASGAIAVDRDAFADALKAWRTKRGVTQAEAARLLRVHPQSVSFWEQKVNGCALAATVLRLMELLP